MSDHIVTDVGEEILATYNLCLVGTEQNAALAVHMAQAWLMAETQENLTDLMPDGVRVVIKEWSSDE